MVKRLVLNKVNIPPLAAGTSSAAHLKRSDAMLFDRIPVGSRISWLHNGQYEQFGRVMSVEDMYILVENERTGKTVKVGQHMNPHPELEIPTQPLPVYRRES